MPVPVFTKQFERDVKLAVHRGKNIELYKHVASVLIEGGRLDPIHRDHRLVGSFEGRRECHMESDWLLVYRLDDTRIILERMGSHSDLYSE